MNRRVSFVTLAAVSVVMIYVLGSRVAVVGQDPEDGTPQQAWTEAEQKLADLRYAGVNIEIFQAASNPRLALYTPLFTVQADASGTRPLVEWPGPNEVRVGFHPDSDGLRAAVTAKLREIGKGSLEAALFPLELLEVWPEGSYRLHTTDYVSPRANRLALTDPWSVVFPFRSDAAAKSFGRAVQEGAVVFGFRYSGIAVRTQEHTVELKFKELLMQRVSNDITPTALTAAGINPANVRFSQEQLARLLRRKALRIGYTEVADPVFATQLLNGTLGLLPALFEEFGLVIEREATADDIVANELQTFIGDRHVQPSEFKQFAEETEEHIKEASESVMSQLCDVLEKGASENETFRVTDSLRKHAEQTHVGVHFAGFGVDDFTTNIDYSTEDLAKLRSEFKDRGRDEFMKSHKKALNERVAKSYERFTKHKVSFEGSEIQDLAFRLYQWKDADVENTVEVYQRKVVRSFGRMSESTTRHSRYQLAGSMNRTAFDDLVGRVTALEERLDWSPKLLKKEKFGSEKHVGYRAEVGANDKIASVVFELERPALVIVDAEGSFELPEDQNQGVALYGTGGVTTGTGALNWYKPRLGRYGLEDADPTPVSPAYWKFDEAVLLGPGEHELWFETVAEVGGCLFTSCKGVVTIFELP